MSDREESSEEDYVYDVYYRDDQEHNPVNASNVGSLVWFDGTAEYVDDNDSESELGDFGDEDSNGKKKKKNHNLNIKQPRIIIKMIILRRRMMVLMTSSVTVSYVTCQYITYIFYDRI